MLHCYYNYYMNVITAAEHNSWILFSLDIYVCCNEHIGDLEMLRSYCTLVFQSKYNQEL